MDLRLYCNSVRVDCAPDGDLEVDIGELDIGHFCSKAGSTLLPYAHGNDLMAAVNADDYLSTHTDEILAALERAGYTVGAP